MRIHAYLLIAGLLTSIAGPLRAQSLAEVAKKQEDLRKDAKSTAKVYGNKDLKEVAAPASSMAPQGDATKPADAAAGQAAQPDTSAAPDGVVPTSETKDRAYWSKRIQQAREQVERDRVLADALQTRVNSLDNDVVNRDDPAQRAKLMSERERALVELDRLKKAVGADEKAIAAIEEEARRAGVPPGWLR